jgi:hypothetical protein
VREVLLLQPGIARTASRSTILFGMEPQLLTAPELADVLAELSRLEPIFHWPPAEMSRDALKKMTVDDFWEVGASGRRYAREFVFDVLEQRQAKAEPDVWEISDLYCRKLAEDTYLLTYTLLQDKTRLTRRATIWQRAADGWMIVYHQGTVVLSV